MPTHEAQLTFTNFTVTMTSDFLLALPPLNLSKPLLGKLTAFRSFLFLFFNEVKGIVTRHLFDEARCQTAGATDPRSNKLETGLRTAELWSG